MSLLRPRGSTRAWRRLRLLILDRDGYLCQYPVTGGRCGAQANTVDHIIARVDWPTGQPGVDAPSNLRAACARHNSRGGAAITNGTDPTRPVERTYTTDLW